MDGEVHQAHAGGKRVTRLRAAVCIGAVALVALSAPTRAAQTLVPARGDWVEPLSRLTFPDAVRGWSRSAVRRYPDPGGHSVTYELRAGQDLVSRATAFVYSSARWPGLYEHFTFTLNELRSMSAPSEIVDQQHLPVGAGGRTFESWFGAILFRGGLGDYHQPLAAFLTLSRVRGYYFKWRADVPSSAPPGVAAKVQELVDALPPK